MRKVIFNILFVLSTIALIVTIILFSNPLLKPEEYIRSDILKLTPIGMSMDDVIKVISNNEKWKVHYISEEFGYRRPGKPEPADIALGRETIVGEKSIRVFIGDYRTLVLTSVTIFWGFDENSKLIEVYVWKDNDSL